MILIITFYNNTLLVKKNNNVLFCYSVDVHSTIKVMSIHVYWCYHPPQFTSLKSLVKNGNSHLNSSIIGIVLIKVEIAKNSDTLLHVVMNN